MPFWKALSSPDQCFFLLILWCWHTGDHPQGDLATFGYRPAMDANSLTSFYILATCLNQCVETWKKIRFFFEKAGNIWQIIIFLKKYSPLKKCCPRSESSLILIPVLGPGSEPAPTFIPSPFECGLLVTKFSSAQKIVIDLNSETTLI